MTEKKLVRETNGEEIDFSKIELRFHLSKRFQDKFEQQEYLGFLTGALLLVPNYDMHKWENDKEEDKSTIPLMLVLNNKGCRENLGISEDEYPSLKEFQEESEKHFYDDYVPSEGFFEIIFNRFREKSASFHRRESHVTNRLHFSKF